jgi:hypothetical protein
MGMSEDELITLYNDVPMFCDKTTLYFQYCELRKKNKITAEQSRWMRVKFRRFLKEIVTVKNLFETRRVILATEKLKNPDITNKDIVMPTIIDYNDKKLHMVDESLELADIEKELKET